MLESDIPNNVEYYGSDHKWIDQYFEGKGVGNYSFNTTIAIPDFELIIGDSKTDLDNSKIIFESLKNTITPVQASDLRLWAYLAHDTFWDYMKTRWPIDVPDEDDESGTEKEKMIRRIGSRYFFQASKGKAFVRQGIARLYWSAYLTYDEKIPDPYEYTEYFLSKQDIFTSSTERSLARNKTLLLAALKVLKNRGDLKRTQIREYFLELSQAGGLLMLDSLSEEGAIELCETTLNNVLNVAEQSEEVNDNPASDMVVTSKSIVKARRTDTGQTMTIPIALKSIQTSPSLIGMKVGEKFRIRKNHWIITDIKD